MQSRHPDLERGVLIAEAVNLLRKPSSRQAVFDEYAHVRGERHREHAAFHGAAEHVVADLDRVVAAGLDCGERLGFAARQPDEANLALLARFLHFREGFAALDHVERGGVDLVEVNDLSVQLCKA